MPDGDEVTVPEPLPARVTDSVTSGRVKEASTVLAAVTGTVHRLPLAEGQFDQPAKFEFVDGRAVSVTVVPLA